VRKVSELLTLIVLSVALIVTMRPVVAIFCDACSLLHNSDPQMLEPDATSARSEVVEPNMKKSKATAAQLYRIKVNT
jgi:hypothetical protein